ncbi:winged helix-turn-helix transcriptional regulator [Streptomyces sp. NPDC087440]|uniref:winged helix-turn-helix transcriptional regulator n=1 Tax=Streptomyces sp. NPDC087440 TaxID=3365790 RepID=UPI00380FCC06
MATTGLPPATDADVARVTEALAMITPRWNVRVLLALAGKPLRYTEVATRLPWLHSGQLHPRLRAVCDSGLAERIEHGPRHVTYGLTDRGTALLPVLPLVVTWAEKFLEKPDRPLPAIEQIEDSLTLLTRRHATAILWTLKSRGETSGKALASVVMPGVEGTHIYSPLRQLVDDRLVDTNGTGQPYRLSAAGHALGDVFGALSAWASGQTFSEATPHPLWKPGPNNQDTTRQNWASHPSRKPIAPPATTPARAAQPVRPVWQKRSLFSDTVPAQPTTASAGGARR